MGIFRVYFDSIRKQAQEEGTFFYRSPRGGNWERLKDEKAFGNFRMLSEKPLTLQYGGDTTYTITSKYIEIDIPSEKYANIVWEQARDIFISSRIAITLGTLGMTDSNKILHRVRHHKWIDGVLTKVDRKSEDTDAFGRPFALVEVK